MKALLLSAPGQLEYCEVPDPTLGPDEVTIRVRACGICGSDSHGVDGGTGRRIPPIVMGHEAAGTIVGVGSAVEGWTTGQPVTFDSTVYCGHCSYCQCGLVNLCDNRQVLGVSCTDYRRQGAFAEQIVLPARVLYALPPGVTFVEAAMVEPLAIAAHAVSRAEVDTKTIAIVVGTGIIGLLVVQVLVAAGCQRIIAVDTNPRRLDVALRLGATQALQPDREDVPRAVRDLSEGRGADLAFEAAGIRETVLLSIESVRKGGTVVLVGNIEETVDLPLQLVVTRELTLRTSAASCGEYPACIEQIATKRVDVGQLVSAVAPLSEGAAWFERLRQPGSELLKVVLEP